MILFEDIGCFKMLMIMMIGRGERKRKGEGKKGREGGKKRNKSFGLGIRCFRIRPYSGISMSSWAMTSGPYCFHFHKWMERGFKVDDLKVYHVIACVLLRMEAA